MNNHYTTPEIDFIVAFSEDIITASNLSDMDLENSELTEDNIINW